MGVMRLMMFMTWCRHIKLLLNRTHRFVCGIWLRVQVLEFMRQVSSFIYVRFHDEMYETFHDTI